MKQHAENPCLQAALRLLTYRDHSCAELAAKLRQRGFSTRQIDRSMVECTRLNYLDDERFSHNCIRQLRRKGFGPKRIQEKLGAKGIAYDLVREFVTSDIPRSTQIEDCRSALSKKLNRTTSSSKTVPQKDRLYRFLLGRGFYPEIIRQIIKEEPSLDPTATGDSNQDLTQQ